MYFNFLYFQIFETGFKLEIVTCWVCSYVVGSFLNQEDLTYSACGPKIIVLKWQFFFVVLENKG